MSYLFRKKITFERDIDCPYVYMFEMWLKFKLDIIRDKEYEKSDYSKEIWMFMVISLLVDHKDDALKKSELYKQLLRVRYMIDESMQLDLKCLFNWFELPDDMRPIKTPRKEFYKVASEIMITLTFEQFSIPTIVKLENNTLEAENMAEFFLTLPKYHANVYTFDKPHKMFLDQIIDIGVMCKLLIRTESTPFEFVNEEAKQVFLEAYEENDYIKIDGYTSIANFVLHCFTDFDNCTEEFLKFTHDRLSSKEMNEATLLNMDQVEAFLKIVKIFSSLSKHFRKIFLTKLNFI